MIEIHVINLIIWGTSLVEHVCTDQMKFSGFCLGVDIVLNSLAEEKLQASLRVLAQHGRFLEIGKLDLSNNTALGESSIIKFRGGISLTVIT